ncbi:MAG UNVERIFIED_CONTAM: hypothetical protein LVQ98_00500 [Rickettsiaceae bacterium]|jgi:hypothetical protein
MFTKKKLLIIFFGSILGLLSFFYYESYLDSKDPPFLRADNSPTRMKPEIDASISENNSMIYDNIRSRNYNTKAVKLLPEPEKPLSIRVPENEQEKDIIGEILENISIVEKPSEPLVTDTKKHSKS